MIQVYCRMCGDELEEPAALVFGPPVGEVCQKFHICEMCWLSVEMLITGKNS